MKWTQGPKLFKAFQFVPEDEQRTLDEFEAFIKKHVNHKFDEDTKICRNHKRFLTNLKKPKALKV